MSGIFINYRSGSHVAIVHTLYEQLAGHFGDERVFLDTPSIHAGGRYPDVIRQRLADADVLVAVVHERWLDERNDSGERLLERERDWVREELELALAAGKKIIPVLTDGTRPPSAAELPPSIRELAHRQARHVRGDAVSAGARALIEELERDVAPSWSPRDTVESRPTPAVRPFGAVPVTLALLLLVVPTLLSLRGHPAAGGAPPLTLDLAVVSTGGLLVRLVAGLCAALFQRGINSWERDMHAMAPMRYHGRIGLPTGVLLVAFGGAIAIVGALSWHLPGLAVYVVIVAVFLTLTGTVVQSTVVASREERTDEERTRHWPQPLPVPPDPVVLRRELGRLDDRLGTWSAPLSREQADRARWALRAIGENVGTMRDRGRSRRLWLVEDNPQRLVRYLWWTAATVGLLAAAVVPRTADHLLSPLRGSLTVLVAVVLVGATAAAVLELDHRSLRSRSKAVSADIGTEAERLALRLDELLQPPAWEAIHLAEPGETP